MNTSDILKESLKEYAFKMEKLKADNKRLREALEMIATEDMEGICDDGYSGGYLAKEALLNGGMNDNN